MIVKHNIQINGKAFVKTYSDSGFLIERDGMKYEEAIDPAHTGRVYLQTDIPIAQEGAQT